MKPNWYNLISRALEEGADCGWQQAHKHTDTPEPDTVREAIVDAQMAKLDEIIIFDDDTRLLDKSN